jgi:predicted Zn-dependent protease
MQENQQQGNYTLRERPLLFGFAVQRERPDGSTRISIYWGRIITALLALSLGGWIIIAGALYAYLKNVQEFETVNYSDTVLLPFRVKELRRKVGDHQIKQSIALVNAGNYKDAFRLLHFGVARSPGNLEGRRYIAEFYEFAMKRPGIAADYLLEGLEYGGIQDVEYIQQLLRVLFRNQMDETVQEIADSNLPEEPDLTDINRTLALGAANANYQRGNYDRAEDYLINYNLIESLEGLLISSKISWERGNRIAAITKLEQTLNKFSNSELLLAQLRTYYRKMGDIDKARRFALLSSVNEPLNYKPRLELLYIYNQEGDAEREKNEIEHMFDQFGEDKNALLEFANFAAKTGKVDLADRIRTTAIKNGFEIDVHTMLLLEAYIFSKDYIGALSFSDDLIEKQPEWLTNQWAIFNSLRSIAAFATSRPDMGEIYLQNFLEETNHRPETYLNVASHFLTIDRISQAHKVLLAAYQQIPKNQRILSELIKVELELGNTEKLSELLTHLLKMRRPQIALLAAAYRELGSDRFIFTENRENLLLQISSILREHNQSMLSLETPL